MDNECVTFTTRFGEPVDKAYIDAVQQGYLPEDTLDTSLIRLFTARIKLGMFDPPAMVPYTSIDEKELDSAAHREQARKLAEESMVLLKNDGLLPLKPEIRKIAVVGPLAEQTQPLLGNYAGHPTHIVSIQRCWPLTASKPVCTRSPAPSLRHAQPSPGRSTASFAVSWRVVFSLSKACPTAKTPPAKTAGCPWDSNPVTDTAGECSIGCPQEFTDSENQEDAPITGDVPHTIPHIRKYLII